MAKKAAFADVKFCGDCCPQCPEVGPVIQPRSGMPEGNGWRLSYMCPRGHRWGMWYANAEAISKATHDEMVENGGWVKDGVMILSPPREEESGDESREEILRQQFAEIESLCSRWANGPIRPETGRAGMNRNSVTFFKDGDLMGLRTTAQTEEQFWRDYAEAWAGFIGEEKFTGDWSYQLECWSKQAFEIVAKLRGYKSDVVEERVLYTGNAFAGDKQAVAVE